ncbi:J domain-containing protein [Natrononativus amylolyticus]|uniref:J domain-containing protein n=1 Tax=Natrononativus amylolyticus TaxID=2963434 RepID=UPI0020CCFEDC|nr:J domain-containing protein [Natrononativus amylolyticus]
MTEDLDFYDLLDIPTDASQDDVKQAFREQVRVYHPDLNDDERARAQFTALKKAYDILGDPVERQAYDRLGHAEYVAKRTSGLPSPDVWKSAADSSDDQSSEPTATDDSSASRSRATASATASGSATASQAASSAGHSTRTGHSTRGASAGGNANGDRTGHARTRRTSAEATTEGAGATRERPADGDGESRTAVGRWWHRRNFAWPLIWLSILTYVAGLAHFALENAGPLEELRAALAAAGTDPAALWAVLSSAGTGLESVFDFLAGVELVAPPLPALEWYGVLAGIVALPALGLLAARVGWREDTWGPVSIDETIVFAAALGVATTLLAGPLLAGAVLMPLLFGVVVHRTRQLPGWAPSYGYVCAVAVPLLALAAGAAGYASLPTDLLAFVLVPLTGAFGLPLRVGVRKRFGR